jgi:mRNA interferase MazF
VRRGDLITIALNGDYGKPRPALVVQSNSLLETDSVLVCLVTSEAHVAPLYRLSVPANETTGLRTISQIMVEKIMAVRRDRCGPTIGRVDDATMLTLNRLLTLVVGAAD